MDGAGFKRKNGSLSLDLLSLRCQVGSCIKVWSSEEESGLEIHFWQHVDDI